MTRKQAEWNKPFKKKEPVDPNNPTHYISNDAMYTAMVEYKSQVAEALAAGKEQPRIPNYLGMCFLQIAQRLATKYNFRNYSYINDMISAGVETCVKNCLSFDPNRSKYIFSYFTRSVWNAFIEVIGKEHRQADYKRQLFLEVGMDTFDLQEHDDDNPEFRQNFNDYIKGLDLDKPLKTKPVKLQEPKALETFFE